MSHEAKVRGEWFITLYGPDGKIKEERRGFNVVTTVGKQAIGQFIASAANGATTFTGRYIAIGTDATAEAVGNTALGTELSRQTGTPTYVTGAIYQVTATFATGSGTGSIVEYGLFNSSTGGTLIARDTEPSISKGASDVLVVTAQMTIS